jgi:hypothetical protein
VRTTVIVFSPPRLDDLPGLDQRREPVHIQALGAQGAVERLHVRVVGRFPRPGEVDLHPVPLPIQSLDAVDNASRLSCPVYVLSLKAQVFVRAHAGCERNREYWTILRRECDIE